MLKRQYKRLDNNFRVRMVGIQGCDPNFIFSSFLLGFCRICDSYVFFFSLKLSINGWVILKYNVLIVTIIVLVEQIGLNTASDCDNISMEIE